MNPSGKKPSYAFLSVIPKTLTRWQPFAKHYLHYELGPMRVGKSLLCPRLFDECCEPRKGHPVGVELCAGHWLEQVKLCRCHKAYKKRERKVTVNKYQCGTNLPPQCDANLPPQCDANLPPQCDANLPPQCVANLPPQCDANLPPQCDANLPPQCDANLPPQCDANLPPQCDANLPPQCDANLPPQCDANLPPQCDANLPPQCDANLPPQCYANLPPQCDANLPPQCDANLPPQCDANLPPQCDANLPPQCDANLPPQCDANLPPQCYANLPPQCDANLPPQCDANLPPQCDANLPPQCDANLPPQCDANLPPQCVQKWGTSSWLPRKWIWEPTRDSSWGTAPWTGAEFGPCRQNRSRAGLWNEGVWKKEQDSFKEKIISKNEDKIIFHIKIRYCKLFQNCWVALSVYPTSKLFKVKLTPYCLAWHSQDFYFNLKRDRQKNSYECHDYESVDEKSLS